MGMMRWLYPPTAFEEALRQFELELRPAARRAAHEIVSGPEQDRQDELRVAELLGLAMTRLSRSRDRWRKLALLFATFSLVLLTIAVVRLLQ
jgi:hypothetical protein